MIFLFLLLVICYYLMCLHCWLLVDIYFDYCCALHIESHDPGHIVLLLVSFFIVSYLLLVMCVSIRY